MNDCTNECAATKVFALLISVEENSVRVFCTYEEAQHIYETDTVNKYWLQGNKIIALRHVYDA